VRWVYYLDEVDKGKLTLAELDEEKQSLERFAEQVYQAREHGGPE
jgi:hypothetical protein